MVSGAGVSEHFPDINESAYFTWALAQTPLDHVTETAAAMDRMYSFCSQTMTLEERLSPFTETAVLDLLGISAPDLESCVTQGNAPDESKDVLIFGLTDRGDTYTAMGDILAAGGHAVTVASPDLRNKQRQELANPGITYLRKSMGELHKDDADPGFSLAILENRGGRLDKEDQVIDRPREHKRTFSAKERLRNTLRVIQPAGRLLITGAVSVRHVNELMTEDRKFAKEIDRSFDLKYLHAYAINKGHPHPIVPFAIFERG